jgi:hypothetical protein
MWEPQPLTTLRASKACRRENFTLPFKQKKKNMKMLYIYEVYYNAVLAVRQNILKFVVILFLSFVDSKDRISEAMTTSFHVVSKYNIRNHQRFDAT